VIKIKILKHKQHKYSLNKELGGKKRKKEKNLTLPDDNPSCAS